MDSSAAAPAPAGPSLKARASRLLAMRDYGRAELERKLKPYAADTQDLALALDALQAQGWISDERAAAAHMHRRASKLGAARVLVELRQKGFDPELIAVQAGILQETEENRLKNVWQKKFAAPPANSAERAKQQRFLVSRGFSTGAIAKLMRSLGSGGDDEKVELREDEV